MKKTLLLAIVLFLFVGLCSCGDPEPSQDEPRTPGLSGISVLGSVVEDFSSDVFSYELEYDPMSVDPKVEDVLATKENESDVVEITEADNKFVVKVSDATTGLFAEYSVIMKPKSDSVISSEIVNKNGAKGVLTLISDDGDQRTADFLYTEIAPTYSGFKITIAMPTKKIATLSTTPNGKAWLIDENGKYSLKILDNEYKSSIANSVFDYAWRHPTMVDFWLEITSTGQIEIASHSHTHAKWGLTDEYNSPYPEGNVIKEIRASAQILRDLLGQESHFILRPGGHTDLTSDYFYSLVETDDTYLGMRSSNGAAPFLRATNADAAKLNTVEKFKTTYGRLRIATILVRGYEAAFNEAGNGFVTTADSTKTECIDAGISAWTQYVDYAMEFGSWASIGFHGIVSDKSQGSGYQVYDSQVRALMDYVQPLVDSGDLWLASFSDAAKYYFEWSSASVSAKCVDGDRIEITLTDKEEDERFDEELTVKVSVPVWWESAQLTSYESTTELEIHVTEDGDHFVYANILPGDEISVISPLN